MDPPKKAVLDHPVWGWNPVLCAASLHTSIHSCQTMGHTATMLGPSSTPGGGALTGQHSTAGGVCMCCIPPKFTKLLHHSVHCSLMRAVATACTGSGWENYWNTSPPVPTVWWGSGLEMLALAENACNSNSPRFQHVGCRKCSVPHTCGVVTHWYS